MGTPCLDESGHLPDAVVDLIDLEDGVDTMALMAGQPMTQPVILPVAAIRQLVAQTLEL
ncbi:MAG: hypothetical protein AB8G96_06385 [Phycisphaerales bacterium]